MFPNRWRTLLGRVHTYFKLFIHFCIKALPPHAHGKRFIWSSLLQDIQKALKSFPCVICFGRDCYKYMYELFTWSFYYYICTVLSKIKDFVFRSKRKSFKVVKECIPLRDISKVKEHLNTGELLFQNFCLTFQLGIQFLYHISLHPINVWSFRIHCKLHKSAQESFTLTNKANTITQETFIVAYENFHSQKKISQNIRSCYCFVYNCCIHIRRFYLTFEAFTIIYVCKSPYNLIRSFFFYKKLSHALQSLQKTLLNFHTHVRSFQLLHKAFALKSAISSN